MLFFKNLRVFIGGPPDMGSFESHVTPPKNFFLPDFFLVASAFMFFKKITNEYI